MIGQRFSGRVTRVGGARSALALGIFVGSLAGCASADGEGGSPLDARIASDGGRFDGGGGSGGDRPDLSPDPDARVTDADPIVLDEGPIEEDMRAPTPDLGIDATPVSDLGADADVAVCVPGTQRDCPTCAGGTQLCNDGVWQACDTPVERCNGLDDDCDGETDEDFARLGEACSVGDGMCAASGLWRCADDALSAVCDARPGDAGVEGCNGVDDDCDGRVDEGADGAPLSLPCFDGGEAPVGACAAGVSRCVGGVFGACEGQVLPADETCDGRDNDCDGTLDEDAEGRSLVAPCYDADPATENVGVCHGGAQICAGGGVFGTCEGQVRPSLEICDGLDNDCDGVVDDVPGGCACIAGDMRACYGGPNGTAGVGTCAGGNQTCNPNGRAWGACQGQTLPVDERCDGVDNDCDGRLDEAVTGTGAACSAGVGRCLRPGSVVCDGDTGALVCDAVAAAPEAERCDGIDDDCDGRIDEGLSLGTACSEGIGECRRDGARVCGAGGAVVCSVTAGAPVAELCDGRDNDCDGVADDGLGLGDACGAGVGACARSGSVVCRDNAAVCGAMAGAPAAERCNGTDDDCDGSVDEGNPESNQACVAQGAQGVCRNGRTVCGAGALNCVAGPVGAEVCNGLDDDCDGRTDEDAAGQPLSRTCFGGPAGLAGVGICRSGTQRCAEGAFGACQGEVLPAAETCDGLDNDCNGQPDDLAMGSCVCMAGTSRPCYGGPAGTAGVGRCVAGTQTCNGAGTGYGACQGEVQPAAETCDPADEDCDGQTDDVPNLGAACSAGSGACQRAGTRVCGAGPDPLCNAVAGAPAVEVCDGRDTDCNGLVDDVAGIGANCTSGQGVCARQGRRVCPAGGGALACDAQAGAPGVETCNLIDDDCDGRADEGLDGVGTCNVGAGICARPGTPRCGPAGASCQGTPGAASFEVCNGLDDDCDGSTDEQLDCANIYASCAAALAAGANQSRVYRLQPAGLAAPVNVYCDQQTDGGGWTLVGSTRDTTLNDAGGAWYSDLGTLAPAGPHDFMWNGLRDSARRFDVRFACRDGVAAAAAPFTVDLAFYDVTWYREFTTGADVDSCFSENTGTGVDIPQPARRDLVGNRFAAVGTEWVASGFYEGDRYLEGEDACGDTADFTVDFNDRGMDSDQSDGTDWGEDDTALKCGTSGLATGQWFVFARERTTANLSCPGNDPLEPNDSIATATPARLGPTWRSMICGTNRDFYRFTGTAGQCVRVTARFVHARGDIDLRITNAAGTAITSSVTVTDDESVVATIPADGVLIAEIYGFLAPAAFANDYDLDFVSTPCP